MGRQLCEKSVGSESVGSNPVAAVSLVEFKETVSSNPVTVRNEVELQVGSVRNEV